MVALQPTVVSHAPPGQAQGPAPTGLPYNPPGLPGVFLVRQIRINPKTTMTRRVSGVIEMGVGPNWDAAHCRGTPPWFPCNPPWLPCNPPWLPMHR